MRFGRLARSAAEETEENDTVAVDHSAHASGGEELATTGSAITWLFVTAIALMAAGAGALHLARERRATLRPCRLGAFADTAVSDTTALVSEAAVELGCERGRIPRPDEGVQQ